MHFRRLPATEAAVRRYVEGLWLPYHHDLTDAVDRHGLTDDPDVDVVEAETEFRLDRLDADTHEIWVAIDEPESVTSSDDEPESVTSSDDEPESETSSDDELSSIDAPLAGYVTTEVDGCPTVFDRPDRLVIGDIYVKAPYRGTGLANELMAKAVERADHYDCAELRLDVDIDNERALAFYEKFGFEPYRYQMLLDADDR